MIGSLGRTTTRPSTLARLVSRVTNPCLLSVGLLLLAGLTLSDAASLPGVLATILLCLVVWPAIYVRWRSLSAEGDNGSAVGLTEFLRSHPRDIMVLGLTCGLPCVLVLAAVGAAMPIVATAAALLVTSLGTAVVNLRHSISYHLAAITTLAIAAGFLWGQAFPASLLVVPTVGWARYALGQHSGAELWAGVGVSVLLSMAVFQSLGLSWAQLG